MLYQKLLMRSMPYHVGVSTNGTDFEVHRHPELEFNYCHSGSGYNVIIDGRSYEMISGRLAITGSMIGHEYIRNNGNLTDAISLTVTVGSVFLGEYYAPFSNAVFKCPVFDLNGSEFDELRGVLEELVKNKQVTTDYSKLLERGSIYRLCACILRDIIEPFSEKGNSSELLGISKIERALEYINCHYSRAVTVSEIADVCGYSESNFCKHFKKITGISFHNALNKKRVEVACTILKSTSLPLEEIASETGFADAKSLCRVFKREKGISPSRYRRDN